jgi:hypothetical protein
LILFFKGLEISSIAIRVFLMINISFGTLEMFSESVKGISFLILNHRILKIFWKSISTNFLIKILDKNSKINKIIIILKIQRKRKLKYLKFIKKGKISMNLEPLVIVK